LPRPVRPSKVQALLDNLRRDGGEDVSVPYDEAAEDVGTGTIAELHTS